jgi:hypothetical protein
MHTAGRESCLRRADCQDEFTDNLIRTVCRIAQRGDQAAERDKLWGGNNLRTCLSVSVNVVKIWTVDYRNKSGMIHGAGQDSQVLKSGPVLSALFADRIARGCRLVERDDQICTARLVNIRKFTSIQTRLRAHHQRETARVQHQGAGHFEPASETVAKDRIDETRPMDRIAQARHEGKSRKFRVSLND